MRQCHSFKGSFFKLYVKNVRKGAGEVAHQLRAPDALAVCFQHLRGCSQLLATPVLEHPPLLSDFCGQQKGKRFTDIHEDKTPEHII